VTDNDKLHSTYDLTTQFIYFDRTASPCQCIGRRDGVMLRRCEKHSKPVSIRSRKKRRAA
jgi:hypothetical protein